MRRSTFTVDAEVVQGNAGATATFRCMTVGAMQEYRTTPMTDTDVLCAHLVDWSGIVDDDGQTLPNLTDEPGVIAALYLHEQQALIRLLFEGPDGPNAKN